MPEPPRKQEPIPQLPEADGLRSAQMGFRYVWDVAQEYEIDPKDGVLRERQRSGFRRVYAPAVEPGLVEAFAAVRDDDTLLEFAKRFGLLGFSRIDPAKKLFDLIHSLPESKSKDELLHVFVPLMKPGGGDPVSWAIARARDVRTILEVQSLLEEVQATGSTKTLRRQLPKLSREAGLRLGGRDQAEDPEKFFEHMGKTERWTLTGTWPNDPARAAWECLAVLINPLVKGIRFEVSPGDEVDVPNLALRFDALLNVIGWRVATQLRRLKPYICKECGRLAFATRSTRETCSFECRKEWWKKHGKQRKQKRERGRSKR